MAIFVTCASRVATLRLEVSCLVGTNCPLVYIGDSLHSLKLLERRCDIGVCGVALVVLAARLRCDGAVLVAPCTVFLPLKRRVLSAFGAACKLNATQSERRVSLFHLFIYLVKQCFQNIYYAIPNYLSSLINECKTLQISGKRYTEGWCFVTYP